jgi:hypothetical protein
MVKEKFELSKFDEYREDNRRELKVQEEDFLIHCGIFIRQWQIPTAA